MMGWASSYEDRQERFDEDSLHWRESGRRTVSEWLRSEGIIAAPPAPRSTVAPPHSFSTIFIEPVSRPKKKLDFDPTINRIPKETTKSYFESLPIKALDENLAALGEERKQLTKALEDGFAYKGWHEIIREALRLYVAFRKPRNEWASVGLAELFDMIGKAIDRLNEVIAALEEHDAKIRGILSEIGRLCHLFPPSVKEDVDTKVEGLFGVFCSNLDGLHYVEFMLSELLDSSVFWDICKERNGYPDDLEYMP